MRAAIRAGTELQALAFTTQPSLAYRCSLGGTGPAFGTCSASAMHCFRTIGSGPGEGRPRPRRSGRGDAVRTDRVRAEGRVGIVTLSRPEKLNAWTPRMMSEYRDAIARSMPTGRSGAIVMTGAAGAFCAGADIGAVFTPR